MPVRVLRHPSRLRLVYALLITKPARLGCSSIKHLAALHPLILYPPKMDSIRKANLKGLCQPTVK